MFYSLLYFCVPDLILEIFKILEQKYKMVLIHYFLHSKWKFCDKALLTEKGFSKFLIYLCLPHLIPPSGIWRLKFGWLNHRVVHKEVFDKKRNEENSFPTCPKELWGKKEDRKKKRAHAKITSCLSSQLDSKIDGCLEISR